MRSALFYLKICPVLVCAAASLLPEKAAFATTLNFSATLTNVTCSISLDKSTLPLGNITISELQPEKLLKAQPFILSVRDCAGATGGSDTPIVMIRGDGVSQDNKWLFRNAGSANNVGIVVIKSDVPPSYSQPEIKNETSLSLSSAGQIPADQTFTFYAGASCGGTSGCTSIGSGSVTASLYFTFEYQ